ncbi:hypothetical protein HDV00_009432 [Rhizophlyctis rosea]|nr:hypothetical protein HDV00_009432 [Rhizophlyctis rosea]
MESYQFAGATFGNTAVSNPVLVRMLTPEKTLQLEIFSPPSTTSPFLDGYPGITPFTLRAIIRVTNTNKTKYKNIHSLKLEFVGATFVSTMTGHYFEMHLEKIVKLVEPPDEQNVHQSNVKATGTSRLPPLAPGETKDFEFSFEVPSPAQGGPIYMPHSMEKPYGTGTAFTRYGFNVKLYMPQKGLGFLTSDPIMIEKDATVPFTWYDQHELEDLLHVQTLTPKPGWENGIPMHLSTYTPPIPPETPITFDLTFLNGLTFDIDGTIDFTVRITPKPTHQNVTVKSLLLTITQSIHTLGRSQTTGKAPTLTYTIFKYSLGSNTSNSHIDFHKPNTCSAPLLQQTNIDENPSTILPSRHRAGVDKHFIVKHTLDITVGLVGAKDVKVQAPCTVVPWKRADVMRYMDTNPDVVREVVHGMAPMYFPEGDAPAYGDEAPGYVEAVGDSAGPSR